MSKALRPVHTCRHCGGYIPDDDSASLLAFGNTHTRYKKTRCTSCGKPQLEATFEEYEDQPDPFGFRLTTADDGDSCSKNGCHRQAVIRKTWFETLDRAELQCIEHLPGGDERIVNKFVEIISDND